MTEKVWTVSNLLSIARILTVIPIIFLLLSENYKYLWYLIGLMVLAAFTDVLDGYLARKLNQVTELGKILDPLADKIAIVGIGIVMTLQGRLPLWFFMIVLFRDVLIFLGGVYIKRSRNIVLQSNPIGKIAVLVLALYFVLILLNFQEIYFIEYMFLYLCAVLLFVSFVIYFKRFINILMTPK